MRYEITDQMKSVRDAMRSLWNNHYLHLPRYFEKMGYPINIGDTADARDLFSVVYKSILLDTIQYVSGKRDAKVFIKPLGAKPETVSVENTVRSRYGAWSDLESWDQLSSYSLLFDDFFDYNDYDRVDFQYVTFFPYDVERSEKKAELIYMTDFSLCEFFVETDPLAVKDEVGDNVDG